MKHVIIAAFFIVANTCNLLYHLDLEHFERYERFVRLIDEGPDDM